MQFFHPPSQPHLDVDYRSDNYPPADYPPPDYPPPNYLPPQMPPSEVVKFDTLSMPPSDFVPRFIPTQQWLTPPVFQYPQYLLAPTGMQYDPSQALTPQGTLIANPLQAIQLAATASHPYFLLPPQGAWIHGPEPGPSQGAMAGSRRAQSGGLATAHRRERTRASKTVDPAGYNTADRPIRHVQFVFKKTDDDMDMKVWNALQKHYKCCNGITKRDSVRKHHQSDKHIENLPIQFQVVTPMLICPNFVLPGVCEEVARIYNLPVLEEDGVMAKGGRIDAVKRHIAKCTSDKVKPIRLPRWLVANIKQRVARGEKVELPIKVEAWMWIPAPAGGPLVYPSPPPPPDSTSSSAPSAQAVVDVTPTTGYPSPPSPSPPPAGASSSAPSVWDAIEATLAGGLAATGSGQHNATSLPVLSTSDAPDDERMSYFSRAGTSEDPSPAYPEYAPLPTPSLTPDTEDSEHSQEESSVGMDDSLDMASLFDLESWDRQH
ncbi:hypothetical protein BV25DRAFT_1913393 [Artomyces pyxidatus]|uniref:Uncharacterized protein n=1 Tax=Artomyces pyxidatus TaxID=48021 RepID=A0ACB8TCL7_9AGAM|nr:hypothetical protein BV25DRAFT_1913393 [Artomyces pyxidatus]